LARIHGRPDGRTVNRPCDLDRTCDRRRDLWRRRRVAALRPAFARPRTSRGSGPGRSGRDGAPLGDPSGSGLGAIATAGGTRPRRGDGCRSRRGTQGWAAAPEAGGDPACREGNGGDRKRPAVLRAFRHAGELGRRRRCIARRRQPFGQTNAQSRTQHRVLGTEDPPPQLVEEQGRDRVGPRPDDHRGRAGTGRRIGGRARRRSNRDQRRDHHQRIRGRGRRHAWATLQPIRVGLLKCAPLPP
jgi:hypothetical protein